ncbi:MAG: nucleoside deaminase [Azovibrio sp.]|nr:nucleoside deaminase [Azovibrio sp.]
MQPSPFNDQDQVFLRRTLELARDNVERGDGGPFGALVARDGRIIAEGWNRVVVDHDPTAHAEILAIRAACRELGHFHLEGCTLYASSEPCPMCLAAAYWARVDRIIYANDRTVAAAIGFCDDELYDQLNLPPEARRVPMLHLPLENAAAPLLAWEHSSRKTAY